MIAGIGPVLVPEITRPAVLPRRTPHAGERPAGRAVSRSQNSSSRSNFSRHGRSGSRHKMGKGSYDTRECGRSQNLVKIAQQKSGSPPDLLLSKSVRMPAG